MSIAVIYKGLNIYFNEDSNRWIISEDGHSNYESLVKAKARIDRACKEDFTRYTILKLTSKGFVEVTVTSVTDGGEYWIINETGRRERLNGKYGWGNGYYLDTPENREKLTEISLLQNEQAQLVDRIKSLINKLPSIFSKEQKNEH